jgi:ribosomal protein S18 acetylase RimI-like enzyme
MIKLIQHVRFDWDLTKIPIQPIPLPPKHEIKVSTDAVVDSLWEGMQKAFLNEKGWIIQLEAHLDQLRRKIFPDGKPLAEMDILVLQHGARVVGVSALLAKAEEPVQLLSGVVLDYEYQRRGLGTALLEASLRHLADRGLERASVITREGVTAARFLYPKFGGKSTQLDAVPLKAS